MPTIFILGPLIPIPIFALVLALGLLSRPIATQAIDWIRRHAVTLGAVALALYAATALAYLAVPTFFYDHVEAQIASVAFRALSGDPIYHPLDDARRYSLLYGPATYLAPLLSYKIFGAGFMAAKLPGLMALAGTGLALWIALRALMPAREVVALLGLGALLLASFIADGYRLRPDSLLLFAAALPLPGLAHRRPLWAAIGLGTGVALAFALKAHGPLYLAPAAALLLLRHGWRPGLVALATAAILTPIPFLHPAVDIGAYLDWLRKATQHGLRLGIAVIILQCGLFLLLPLGWLLPPSAWRRADRPLIAALIAAIVVVLIVAVIGAKPLAGPRHLLPLVPVALYLAAELRGRLGSWPTDGRRMALAVAWLATATIMAFAAQGQVAYEATVYAGDHDAADEIMAVQTANPGVAIEMGYAGGPREYRLSWLRPLLIFAGQPYSLDAAAVMDMQAAGLPLPAATLQRLADCTTRWWLIPRGHEPFTLRTMYPPNPPLFDAAFAGAFRDRYRLIQSGDYFDVWGCNG